MDYETKPTNRKELRLYAKLFRSICGLSNAEPIDPIELLDRLPELEGFEDVRYEIVYNNELPGNVPAQCVKDNEGYLIQIKESVYMGAYEKQTGGHRMHIMHEIGHIDMGHKHGSQLAEVIANHYAGYALAPSPLIQKYNCEDFGDISVVFNISDECAYWRFNSYQNWIKYRIKKKYEKELLNYLND